MRALFLCSIFFSGFFLHAQQAAQVKLVSTGVHEQWKTVELALAVPAQERAFRQFLDGDVRGRNPYTSRFLWLQFICNGRTYNRPAYYMEEAYPDLKQNRYVTEQAEFPWRVRFSPPEAGTYEVLLLSGENEQQAQPAPTGIRFEVVRGNRHGILQTRPGAPRLTFTDGTPFFVIGQNIAWSDTMLRGGPVPGLFPVYQAGFFDWFHYLHNLADNGGNYVRIYMAPWGAGIETQQVGVYRQDKARAMDSIIQLAEERGLYVQLAVDLTMGFANEPEKDWHPIRRAFQKPGMTAADLLTDSAALKALDDYLCYVHARWGYSANVAVLELLGEIDRWNGWKENQEKFYSYFTHAHQLLTQTLHDTLHIMSTSVTNGKPLDIFRHPAIAFMDMHPYDNDRRANEKRYFIFNRREARNINKPFIFGEMGVITHGADPDDWEYCNDISYHNALWSTTFMGGMGTGLNWWQWHNDQFRAQNFKPLRRFVDSVANGMHEYTDAAFWSGNGLEVFYSRSRSKGAAGWVHNSSSWWANVVRDCKDRSGKRMVPPKDDDRADTLVDRTGNTFLLTGLESRERYFVYFFDTREPGKSYRSQLVNSGYFGRLRLVMPVSRDCAFLALRYYLVSF